MTKRALMCGMAILFVVGVVLAGQGQKPAAKEGSWSGWVTDNKCGEKGANANHAACAEKCVKERGGKYALWDTSQKRLYILEPQSEAAAHVAHEVNVTGKLEGDTIHVSSIKMTAPSKPGI